MFRKFFALLVCSAASIAVAQQPPKQPVQAMQPQAQPSRPLADVAVKTPDAKGINFKKYRGKELVIVLFSTQCEDCVTTVGYLSQLQKDDGPRGLQVIGVGVNKNAPYELGPWMQRYRPGFPMGFLDQDSMLKLVALPKDTVPYVPIVMFVDSGGTVRAQYTGDSPLFKDKSQGPALRAIAEGLLKFQAQHASAKAASKSETSKPESK